LFKPSLVGKDSPGIAELVKKAINQCDLDVRRSLWENVLIAGISHRSFIVLLLLVIHFVFTQSGGTSMLPGFVERLEVELKKIAPENTVPVLNVAPNRFAYHHLLPMVIGVDVFNSE